MKRFLILAFFIYFAVSKGFAATSVISEFEDTFKRTRGESFRGFYNSVLSHKIFGGMDSLAKEVSGDLYFVSETYNLLKFNAEELVEEFEIKPKEIVGREPFEYESDYAYKYATYKRIIEGSKDTFILVGSDKGVDQEVFAQIKKEYPKKVLKMYIHVVDKNRNLLDGMTPYHTAFDIALSEYKDKRLTYAKTKKIGEAILGEEKFHKVFPLNVHCPKEMEELTTRPVKEFDQLIGKVSKKTIEFCNS